MISFKDLVFIGVIGLGFVFEVQAKCDFKSVTHQCEFFKNLKPTDIIQLANGEKVPACTLSAVFSAQAEEAMGKVEESQVELRDYLSSLPSSAMSTSFKQRLAELGLNNLGDLTYPNEAKVSVPWPPNKEGAKAKSVSVTQIINYMESQEGIDKDRLLRLLRASDQNQNRHVALSMDTDQRSEYLRTPQQTQAIFNQVKTNALEVLRQGQSDSQLSPEMQSVIGRVNAYYLSQNSSGQPGSLCGPGRGQGGRNNTAQGFIELGPKMNYFPAGAVQRTLAHEFAHAFDPCRSNTTMLRASEEFAQLARDRGQNNPGNLFGIRLPPGSESQLMGSEVVGAPFSIDQNPFRDTYNCLINQGEGRTGHPLNRGLGNFHTRQGEYLSQNGAVRSESQACEFSQGNEIFCDWFAAQVLEQTIKKDPPPRPSPDRPLPEGVVAAPPGYEYLIYNLDEACAEEISGAPSISGSDHPSDRRRVDLILNNPTVAEALGCPRTPDSEVICPASQTVHHTGTTSPTTAPSPSPQKKPQKKSDAHTVD